MPDHARSTDPAVQRQLDRLWRLSPGADILGLERITALLARVGDPHLRLPPVFHVAGTNGKGSTCAFLRTALEAAGHRVHVYTSPHLVRFNERIRLAGTLIDDAMLAKLLEEVLDAGGDIGASFFEVTTAAAFLAFARTPADACVIEVGLGGRLDATNVVTPVVCGIAALGIDHQAFLGDTLEEIAAEKAGIAKPGVPLVTSWHPAEAKRVVQSVAHDRGASYYPIGEAWAAAPTGSGVLIRYWDAQGDVLFPRPRLPGVHQVANAALSIAMLRHQTALEVSEDALAAGVAEATWPGRLQRLRPGPLTKILARGTPLMVDGGHNPSAGRALSDKFGARDMRGLSVVLGMLANKDAAGFLTPLATWTHRLVAVPVPGHDHHSPETLVAIALGLGIKDATQAPDLPAALGRLRQGDTPGPVLIAGSLYLVGEALAANDELPT